MLNKLCQAYQEAHVSLEAPSPGERDVKGRGSRARRSLPEIRRCAHLRADRRAALILLTRSLEHNVGLCFSWIRSLPVRRSPHAVGQELETGRWVYPEARKRTVDLALLQFGKMVFELRPARASKGDALERFLQAAPFKNRLPVAIGDDLTDESMFAVANARGGVSVRVGSIDAPSCAGLRAATAAIAGLKADPRAGGCRSRFPAFCRRYAKPPAATLFTGLAGGERLSQFLLQLVCPSFLDASAQCP